MSLWVDSSALLRPYVEEPDSEVAESFLPSERSLLTARHTIVECAGISPGSWVGGSW